MKKVKYFFASFLPFLAIIGIQFLAAAFVMGIAFLFLFPPFPGLQGKSFDMSIVLSLVQDTTFSAVLSVVYSITTIIGFAMWYYHSCGGELLPHLREHFHPLLFLGIIIFIPGAQFGCSCLISAISEIFPQWLTQYEQLMHMAGMDENLSIFMICYAVILAPIGEELVFRGVTMRLARRALPFAFANILQALLFGLMHGNWIQGCYAFVLGLVLGFICEKGESIYYSILTHILFNFWGVFASDFLSKWLKDNQLGSILFIIVALASLVLGILLFSIGLKKRGAHS